MTRRTLALLFTLYAMLIGSLVFLLSKQAADFESTFRQELSDPYHDRLIQASAAEDNFTAPSFTYRHDLSRHGVDRSAKLSVPVKMQWQSANINIGVHTASKASPAVDDTGVYIGSDSAWFTAFSPTGEIKWRFRASGTNQGIHGTAALDEKFVYFSAYNGRLYKARKEDGQLIWSRQLADAIGSSILLDGEFIYASSETGSTRNGYLAKLRRDTGEMVWRTPWFGEQVHSSPTLSPDRSLVFVGANNGKLYAADTQSGRILWIHETGHPIKGTPTAYENLVAFTSWANTVTALDQKSGKLVWSFALQNASQSSPTYLQEKNLLVVSASTIRKGQIVGLNARTGALIWELAEVGRLIGSALITQDTRTKIWTAWTPCGLTELCALNAENGRLLQRIDLGLHLSGVPTSWHNALYVVPDKGPIMKFAPVSN